MLLIGYMEPSHFLRGSMTLDRDNAHRIFKEKIADPLGVSVEEAATSTLHRGRARLPT